MPLKLGAIADDFTGATDLANTLVKEGMRVVQVIGVPTAPLSSEPDAVVVALKSRTAPVSQAVSESLAALDWLQGQGAGQIFFKYCSTFDSTPQGNIGPVGDALINRLGGPAFVCPAFPTTGRTIYKGKLFVGDQLLQESPMKDHPLTPMTDSDLVRLMAAQSQTPVGLVDWSVVQQGAPAIDMAMDGKTGFMVVDAIRDADLREIGKAAKCHSLITGGSGVALGLPANFGISPSGQTSWPDQPGRKAILAGSCSTATRGQIVAVRGQIPHRRIDVDALAAGADPVAELLEWAAAQDTGAPVMITASDTPEEVARIQTAHGREKAGAMVEDVMGRLAQGLVERGVTQLVVAGGETSGAVVSALGVKALRIGPQIDPGVPWCEAEDRPLALALKSGNFGGADFFRKAFEVLA